MSVIPKRIAGVVLHMPDQHVMPVCNIERAVGGELQIHRPEIGIISPEQILTVAAAVARSVILQGVLLGAQESDRIVNQEITLYFVRTVTAGYKIQSRCQPYQVITFNISSRFSAVNTLSCPYGSWHH